jgi:hypothetical protein
VGIGGFIISGTVAKRVVIRGLGPSLKSGTAPVPGALNDPILELHDNSGATLFTNDNWKDNPAAALITASGLAPTDDREAAIQALLPPGQYTGILRGANNSTGVGLVEIYDLDSVNGSQLANLAARASVLSGDNVLIGGLILRGSTPKRVLFRAIGPELSSKGVTGALLDPTLSLHDGNGTLQGFNDNWPDATNASEIQATGIAPTDNRESAILMTLMPGNYTGIVRGAGGTTGIAVAEAYKLDN